MEQYGFNLMLCVLGVVCIASGIVALKFPDLEWKLNLTRAFFVKGGEPSEFYYTMQRAGAVLGIFFGAILMIVSLSLMASGIRGYVVKVDGEKLKIPCTYEEVQALGYWIDPSVTVKVLGAYNGSVKNQVAYTVKNAAGKEMEITFENREAEELPATECTVVGIASNAATGPAIVLPEGIEMGMTEQEAGPRMGTVERDYPSVNIVGFEKPENMPDSGVLYVKEINLNRYEIYLGYSAGYGEKKKIMEIRVND